VGYSNPSEPLLPVEPAPPSKLKWWILLGGIAAAGLTAAAVILLSHKEAPPPPEEGAAPTTTDRPATRVPGAEAGKPRTVDPRDRSEEKEAKALYDAAEAFERAEPAEFEKRIARWREVVTKFPTSGWAAKADERHRAATASLQKFLDREFESTRKDAQSLSAAGHFVDAIEAIQTYRAAQTRDILKRRADMEIAAIENASRLAFNESASKAKELAAKGDHAGASAVFESIVKGAIPEVASRCQKAIAQLRTAAAAASEYEQARKADSARRALREEVVPKVLAFVRARQYEEALKELSAAAGAAGNAALKDEIVAERASIADASSFWEAFLKSLRGKSGQDVTLLLADGKRMAGKIARIQPDRVVLDVGDGTAEVPLDKLHADLLVGWTIGKGLPPEDGVTYVKAALFFFCDGRDDLARLYLATARELNGPVDPAEKVFREGFLRAAIPVKK
jgi:tetratricopeptide (TPR) repeat protein